MEKPWASSFEEIINELDTDQEKGLSNSEAEKRIGKYGKNSLREKKKKSGWEIFFDQFKSLIVAILLGATILSFAFGELVEGSAILLVIIVNSLIGFFTEYKAARSMEALQKLSQVEATVRRDGRTKSISAEEIVPGDIILLEGGDVITADLRLIETNKLQIDESSLTGESVPVTKQSEKIDEKKELAERNNMAFKGTAVTGGSGSGIVAATGMDTELGHISELVEEAEEEVTPIEKRLEKLGQKLIWLTIGLSVVVGVLGLMRGKEIYLMVKTAVALAIAAIPEGLPIVATVALARGMLRMAKKNALIKKLASVETLGAANIICTDKTGTLTENKMTLVEINLPDTDIKITGEGFETEGEFRKDDQKISPDDHNSLKEALIVGALCNNASLSDKKENVDGIDIKTIGDPLEIALLVAAAKAGYFRDELLEKMPEEKEIAFDPEIKMMATFHKTENGKYKTAIKGAPEAVIEAAEYLYGNEDKKLDKDEKRKWIEKNNKMANEGLRVLALGVKESDSVDENAYKKFKLLGLIGLLDPPREGVKEAIDECKQAGIKLVMVTGDHKLTAKAIAEKIGLNDDDPEAAEGRQLKNIDELSEDKKQKLAEKQIFARVSPKQKLDLITLHQKRGGIIAMTGDGVNDAPALKKADIGIAMGQRGTEVAREAADMVLKDDALSSIVSAIRYGRGIFRNIRKFVLYLLSGNVGEILAVASAFAVGSVLPLLPLQILFLNFGIDVFPALAIGVGEADPKIMQEKPRKKDENILTKRGWFFIGFFGILIGISVLTSFYLSQSVFGISTEEAVTLAFLTQGLSRLWHLFNMRDQNSPFLLNEITRNKFIWYAWLICILLLIAAIYLPGLSDILSTHIIPLQQWGFVVLISLFPLIVGQLLKLTKFDLMK